MLFYAILLFPKFSENVKTLFEIRALCAQKVRKNGKNLIQNDPSLESIWQDNSDQIKKISKSLKILGSGTKFQFFWIDVLLKT